MKYLFVLTFCCIVSWLCAPCNVWGQFAVQVQPTPETIQTLDFESDPLELSQTQFAGNNLMTIGKTMTVTATMAGLSHSIISFFALLSGYQATPVQKYSSRAIGITEVTSLLVGIPLWIIGKTSEKHPEGEQYLGNPKGFGLRVDLAAAVTPIMGVDCIAGYHLNPYLFVGGGIGSRFVEGLVVPAFVDIRATYSPKRVAPYIGLKGGISYCGDCIGERYEPFDSFFSLNLGVRIRHKNNDKSRGDWWCGCVIESSPTTGINNGLQVSYSF